ncbi:MULTISPECIES: Abi family protein [Paenibacillus]|uniref:Abi family protein n=1 Tax=Paenibacillus TaxID=44249 RepID=UPI000A88891E|nr:MULTISPECIES: Abi family protein [Paenibacillus]
MSTHVTKTFKSLDQQIELLKERKLIIRDENKAKQHLLEKNYFDLINGFETLLLIDSKAANKEYNGLYFEDFLLLYDFDKKLNLEILKILDKFEIRLKTSMAYRFCEKYFLTASDSACYIDINKYTDPRLNHHHLSLPQDLRKYFSRNKVFETNRSFKGATYSNFIELCKAKYPYISTYDHPPFWVTIKVLEFGPLFNLLLGFEKDIFEKVINDMGMKYIDKQKFINSIQIFIELRNTCAHFQLVNRFRTSKNLRIDAGMKSDLDLRTKTNTSGVSINYEIRLYDTLLVLSQFESLKNIGKLCQNFYFKRCTSKREKRLMLNIFERMGRKKHSDWFKISVK